MRDNIANLKHSSLKKTFQTIAFEELKKVYVYVIYVYIYTYSKMVQPVCIQHIP